MSVSSIRFARDACASSWRGTDLHDRKARKVSNVMGCELRRQLSEPGAGDCWWSMAFVRN